MQNLIFAVGSTVGTIHTLPLRHHLRVVNINFQQVSAMSPVLSNGTMQ